MLFLPASKCTSCGIVWPVRADILNHIETNKKKHKMMFSCQNGPFLPVARYKLDVSNTKPRKMLKIGHFSALLGGC